MPKINYVLNNGFWAPKDEVKEAFYTDLYNFVNEHFDTELKSMSLNDFIVSEPYIIGNMCGKYYLQEEVGGKLENQPDTYFIGYCYKNKKYLKLIPHLIHFFALWRDIEGCREENATDFFANSWASLVDTAKFFKYTTVEELEKSPESPTVRCEPILTSIQNCPEVYPVPYEFDSNVDTRLPKPRRDNYEFLGWFTDPNYRGESITHLKKGLFADVTVYARWGTHTYFHSNDGYATFDDLYTDFLNDYSLVMGRSIGKDAPRIANHGPVSEFCTTSENGGLNKFFSVLENYEKWLWLVEYLRSLKKNEEMKEKFVFTNGKFNDEDQVRWELNSLFVKRFHTIWPYTGDYSGAGVREKIADLTNTSIVKVKYPVGENVTLPKVHSEDKVFVGWFTNPQGTGEEVKTITDDKYAAMILYAKWK